MRAIILSANHGPFPQALLDRRPLGLMPLGPKPILQHIIEGLARQDIKHVSVSLGDQADYVMTLLGAGERWGGKLDYILPSAEMDLAEILNETTFDPDDDILILPSLVLTNVSAWDLLELRGDDDIPVAAVFEGQSGKPAPQVWLAKGRHLRALAPGIRQNKASAEHLAGVRTTHDGCAVGIWDTASYWQANQDYLHKRPPFTGPEDHFGHRARIHRRASLIEPMLIGWAANIGAGCHIGPEVVVGDNCILDDGIEAKHCIILPGTFVGRNTTLEGVIADQGLLVNIEDGTSLHVPDPFILGPASAISFSGLISVLIQRALAGVLLVLSLPILGLAGLLRLLFPSVWINQQRVVFRELAALDGRRSLTLASLPVLRLPWPVLAHLPSLYNVVRGDINLVGVEPLPIDQADALQGGWTDPRFHCRAGLVGPWLAEDATDQSDIERRVMEIYYVQTQTLGGDMRLLAKAALCFLRRVLRIRR